MKFFHKKANILDLLLIVGAFVSFYLGEILTFTTAQKVFVGIVFLFLILLVSLSPRQKSEEERIEEEDERNQYIALKCAAETLHVVGYTAFLTIVSSILCFGLTREFFFIWVLVGAAIPYGILKISMLLLSFRYDR